VQFFCLFLLFFGLFVVSPSTWKRLNSAIFGHILQFFALFFRCSPPLEFFSADALECAVGYKLRMENSIELKKNCLIALLQHHYNLIELVLFKLRANRAKRRKNKRKFWKRK